MRECSICKETFDNNKSYSNHIRWKHRDQNKKRCEFCDVEFMTSVIKRHEKCCIQNPKSVKEKKCLECGSVFFDLYKKFCSSSCSATNNNRGKKKSTSAKDKISNAIKLRWREGIYEHVDFSQNIKFTSKPEREIVSFFKTNFIKDEWKSGGNLKISEGQYMSRDLYSDKLKVCFEYDGIWHFKDIHGQLDKKQLKDKLLYDWCLKNNYRLIRVDEDKFVDLKQIEDLVYKRDEQLILVGERYNPRQVHHGGMTERECDDLLNHSHL